MLHAIKRGLSIQSVKFFATMSSTSSKTVGVGQMRATNDKQSNREQVKELVSRTKGKADFLFLPECCDYVGTNVEETKRLAEPLTGDTVKFYKQLW